MGKTGGDEDQGLSAGVNSSEESVETNGVVDSCCPCGFECFGRLIGLKCLFVLVLSAAVFLSALFWLPPFLQYADQGDLDLDSHFKGHDIVASFYLKRPVPFLQDNILQLEDDILDEITAPFIKVTILSLESSTFSNITKVVFAVDPEVKNRKIPEAVRSLIRSTFQYLVIKQLSLRLNTSLFGDPFFFEVLKFTGGIIIIPYQHAFLLQKVQISFNFTLNFSIHQIQVHFEEMTSQLKSGLNLAPYENLYVKLSNSKGSTVAPPATVHSLILLTVGTPSRPRLKQLAQKITGSGSGNLGLNHSEFGRVKQVSLSSILQHSLNGGDGTGSSQSPSPAPSPNPHPEDHQHHHHHHHVHHHHHHHTHLSPAVSPAPANEKGSSTFHGAPTPGVSAMAPTPSKSSPAPQRSYDAKPPGCHNGYRKRPARKDRKRSFLAPTPSPEMSPHYAAPIPAVAPYTSHRHAAPVPSVAPKAPPHHAAASPRAQTNPRGPVSGSISGSSPLPGVQLPSNGESRGGHSKATPPALSSSVTASAADCLRTIHWAFLLLLAVLYQF